MPNRGAHAMRYTAAVRLLELGFAYEDVAGHLGHSTARMARTYCQKRRAAELRARLLNEVDAAMLPQRIRFADETTEIELPTANSQQPTAVYDLQGRRVANPTKGVYIVNGKKVLF